MRRSAIPAIATGALGIALVLSLVLPGQPAQAAGRCSTPAGNVEQRIAEFWQCVGTLGPADLLTAEDLGQWASNVIERAPAAGLRIADFSASTAGMQVALDRASAGIPAAPPKSADVEDRIASFWQKVNALDSCDMLTATDLGQWALNVIDRDPSRRIRVDDFRASTAGMQAGLDRASDRCSQAATPGTSCPGATGPYAICGLVTRADTGAPVAGARVQAGVPHDPDRQAESTTGPDGRYTVTVPKSHAVYLVSVEVDPQTGLGNLYYGSVTCSFDAAEVKTFGHVGGIDVVLRRGHWIRGTILASGGTPLPSTPEVMRYLPSADLWCDAFVASGGFDTYTAAWSVFVAEGAYRLRWDPKQWGSYVDAYPLTWYPSALTANSASDVLLDRDVSGVDIVVPTGYVISGTARPAFQDEYFWVQVVTMDVGRIGIVREDYLNFENGSYSFVVAPGTYKVRLTEESNTSGVYFYARNGARTYDAGTSIVITNANVTGVDIIR